MIERRIINGLTIKVEEHESNAICLPVEFANNLGSGIRDSEMLKKSIYSFNNNDRYFPLSVTWELTNRCCFNCGFCYIHNQLDFDGIEWTKEKIDSFVDDLISEGMLFCTITGGECLINPNFLYLYELLKQKGVIVSVFTNVFLLGSDELALFRRFQPYKVEVSIYGMEQETFEMATSTKLDYRIVLNNILRLKQNGIMVRCKTPITNLTSSSIPQIRQWCKSNSIEYYTSDELFDSYYGDSVDEFRVYDDVYKSAIQSKEKSIKKKCNMQCGKKKAWDCSAGKYTGVISADGAFYPCMSSVGVQQYRYPFDGGILKAIEHHREKLKLEKNEELPFCKGCVALSVCEMCVLSCYKEKKEEISEKCMYYRELVTSE